jgi:hypothetical protein
MNSHTQYEIALQQRSEQRAAAERVRRVGASGPSDRSVGKVARRVTALAVAAMALALAASVRARPIDFNLAGSPTPIQRTTGLAIQRVSAAHERDDVRRWAAAFTVQRPSDNGFHGEYLAVGGGVIGLATLAIGLVVLNRPRRAEPTAHRQSTIAA